MTHYFSFGFGVGSQNKFGEWLEVFYPNPMLHPETESIDLLAQLCKLNDNQKVVNVDKNLLEVFIKGLNERGFRHLAESLSHFRGSLRPLVAVFLHEDHSPESVPEAYLKLQLISHRLVKPHSIELSGLFGVLPNVAWTNLGAIDVSELNAAQLQARIQGEHLNVESIDKFPKMTDYVVPSGVRIANTARVRLGAYLGEGTTVMHEGFVNFNAGTEGTSMIEGRISAGVIVGEGSDLGGGCSTMGTLSGGGNIIISVGQNCLIGANAGIGIPLGDRCTVEAGLYITAGTKVALLDDKNEVTAHVKARDLAGKNDLLFRRNSVSGAVECKTNRSSIELNKELHLHN